VTSSALKERLEAELAEDREFLRKLHPSLIKARLKGRLPTDGKPGPSQTPARPRPERVRPPGTGSGGPNPWLVLGVAFAVGMFAAKLIDWRGHAHPR
jgi:hypothetical protein